MLGWLPARFADGESVVAPNRKASSHPIGPRSSRRLTRIHLARPGLTKHSSPKLLSAEGRVAAATLSSWESSPISKTPSEVRIKRLCQAPSARNGSLEGELQILCLR